MKIREISDIAVSIDSEKYGTRAYMHNQQGHEQLQFDSPELFDEIMNNWKNKPMAEDGSPYSSPQ